MFRSGWLGYSAIAAATGMAYANSFSAAQVFDGLKFIDEYAGIRQLWPPSGWLATNRPVVFFTFAVNYAMHGTEVWGYHAVNLAIHVLAACVLLALIRDTLASPRLAARYGTHAGSLALAVAMLWAVHPLQTQSVTYVYQRLESLMGLFSSRRCTVSSVRAGPGDPWLGTRPPWGRGCSPWGARKSPRRRPW